METGSFGVLWRPRRRGLLALVAAALVAAAAVGLFLAGHEFRPAVGTDEGLGAATGLGQLSGLLPTRILLRRARSRSISPTKRCGFRSTHVARLYSWSRPPRRSRRFTWLSVDGVASAGLQGGRCSSPWCSRAWL